MATWHKAVLAAALGLAVVSVGGLAFAQADAIKARKDGFQVFRTSAGAIKKVVDDNSAPAGAVAPAEAIASQAARQLQHFPAGSDKGDTKAKPEIWANMAQFEGYMKDLEAKATAVAVAGKAGDAAALKTAFGAMGAACGTCHKAFRMD
ncbi:MAG: cytochrome c [Ferrovibrio sp.]|uniref:c-type cytochrome n=1 Tax=Ferrovibrio sp. TaxID=1917215 RepID=UPI00261D8BA7|nr:cytochrome c [Ferrovibrio sp.]MCW0234256.1 cytochrome c [Ferrovibrio sp.]